MKRVYVIFLMHCICAPTFSNALWWLLSQDFLTSYQLDRCGDNIANINLQYLVMVIVLHCESLTRGGSKFRTSVASRLVSMFSQNCGALVVVTTNHLPVAL